MVANKIIAMILIIIAIFLVYDIYKNLREGVDDYGIEITRTIGAALLLLILAIDFFTTDKSLCETIPFFCKWSWSKM